MANLSEVDELKLKVHTLEQQMLTLWKVVDSRLDEITTFEVGRFSHKDREKYIIAWLRELTLRQGQAK